MDKKVHVTQHLKTPAHHHRVSPWTPCTVKDDKSANLYTLAHATKLIGDTELSLADNGRWPYKHH